MSRQGIDCVDYATAEALAAKINAACGYPIKGKLTDWVGGAKGKSVPIDTTGCCRIELRADTKTYLVITSDDPETQKQIQALGLPMPDTKLDAGDALKVVTVDEAKWIASDPSLAVAVVDQGADVKVG